MKILFLVSEFPSVSQTFVLNQITGLLDRGADVSIAALRAGTQEASHGDFVRYNLARRTIHLTRPSTRTGRTANLLWEAALQPVRRPRLLHRLGRAGLSALTASNPWPSRYARLASIAVLLRHDFDRERFDVVLCHFGPMGLLGLALRQAGLLHGRLVTVFHGFDMSTFLRTLGDDVYAPLFAAGDLFLPISARWKGRLLELGCPPEQTAVHHMGIDPARFVSRPRSWVPGEPLRLVSVARLVEKKGIEHAIRAVALLAASGGPPVSYTVIGDGPLRAALDALVQTLGVREQIHFLGAQPQEVVAEQLGRAHLLLAPSVVAANGDEEGIPVALMEALASGLPVIATRHSGIPELVRDGENGWLVPERDAEALAQAIRRAADAAADWPRLAAAGRRLVETEFNIHRLNDALLDRLRDLARPSPSAATAEKNALRSIRMPLA